MKKTEIFQILREYNYWHQSFDKDYVSREIYISKIRKLLTTSGIIAIKGPRRAGKTVLTKLFIKDLLAQGVDPSQILYVNLEDFRFYAHYSLQLLQDIIDAYRENINSDQPAYCILDEIQNITGFEKFLRTKYDTEDQLRFIITGSNAKLFSQEFGTLLTGRVASLEVFPFSFEEYLRYKKLNLGNGTDYFALEFQKSVFKKYLNDYLYYGGIPEFMANEESLMRQQEYFEQILFRDIASRFKIRNTILLKQLAIFLLSNAGKIFSINNLSKTLQVSINSIQKYLADFQAAYLFFYIPKFSYSLRKQMTAQSKVYALDSSLIHAAGFHFSSEQGRILENAVCVHLLRQGAEIYYHLNNQKKVECDFLVKEGLVITQAIQVTQYLGEQNREREVKGLLDALQSYDLTSGLIITFDSYENFTVDKKYRIRVRPLWFWLLNPQK